MAGKRTRLLRQHVPYPFHVTQPFTLDPARPDLATLFLQSASGGLYRGEQLELTMSAGAGAAVAVTTQAATIVHDCQGQPTRQYVRLTLQRDSLLIYTPDPMVLFPGAALHTALDVTIAPGAIALCQDGFACHDPAGNGSVFDTMRSETIIRFPNGREQMADRGLIRGNTLGTAASPLGPAHWATGNLYLLGCELPDESGLQSEMDAKGCLSGISALPNGLGTGIRLLAPDGGILSRGLLAAFKACFRAATGVTPASRRK